MRGVIVHNHAGSRCGSPRGEGLELPGDGESGAAERAASGVAERAACRLELRPQEPATETAGGLWAIFTTSTPSVRVPRRHHFFY